MQHRRRRRGRRWALVGSVVLVLGLLALPFRGTGQGATRTTATEKPVVAPASALASRPTARAEPQYLRRTYRAPPALVRPGAGGTLRVPSLRITAPIDAVGLDGAAMAVPDDAARVGWLSRTARAGDVIGASVLAGHVSDTRDRPGALARLGRVRLGATITWSDASGTLRRFRVTRVKLFPRNRGLPASLFATDGPHVLHLVTCADRVGASSGFHYRSNLVVTAVR